MPYKGPMAGAGTEATAGGTPARGSARHWMIVAGGACLMSAGMFMLLSTSVLNPPLAKHLGVGLSEVMVYNSMFGIAGVIAMTFIAPAVYRAIGVRAAIVAGGVWMAITFGAVVLVPNVFVLSALGFAQGLVFGMCTTMGASMLVNTWFEEKRGTMMGAVFALSGVGGISAGLVMPAIVNAWGWQGGFLTVAGVMIALVVLPGLFLIRSHPDRVGQRPLGALDLPPDAQADAVLLPGVPARLAFRTPQFIALGLAIVLFGMVQAVSQHFAPLFVEHGVELAIAGTLISVMAATGIVSNLAVGTLNDRRGTVTAALFTLACQVGAMTAYFFGFGFLPLALATVIFSFGSVLPGVLLPIMVQRVFGMRDYATILGPTWRRCRAASPSARPCGAWPSTARAATDWPWSRVRC